MPCEFSYIDKDGFGRCDNRIITQDKNGYFECNGYDDECDEYVDENAKLKKQIKNLEQELADVRDENLKVFVFKEVLKDYSFGMAIVIAGSKEEALQIIHEKYFRGYDQDYIPDLETFLEEELFYDVDPESREPLVYPINEKNAWYCHGGG